MRGDRVYPDWLNVSRETQQKLEAFADLVEKWSQKINLVSRADAAVIWNRHILDSAQLFVVEQEHPKQWLDLGSGGGFPGIVVAILFRPTTKVTLVESDARKCAFLKTACIELSLGADVVNQRIETLPPLQADVISARALTSLDNLLEFASKHLKPSGHCFFLKGGKAHQELTEAKRNWKMAVEKIPSITQPSGTILKIGDLSRV